MQTSGFLYLLGYVLLLGIGTFLQKFSMRQLSPFQLEVLITLGMVIIAVPSLLFAQKSLTIPAKGIPLGGLVGILFASGSLLFTLALSKMQVSIASAVSISYIVIASLLSIIFLKEPINLTKGLGIALTIIGVALLYFQQE